MKKRLSMLSLALCLLLLFCLAAIPVGAADEGSDDWKKLSYRALTPEGEPAGEQIELKKAAEISGKIEILFDPDKSIVEMNGARILPGQVIDCAGNYRFQVYEAAKYVEGGVNNIFITYVIDYAADVVFKNGDKEMVLTSGMVYQFYPTIYCDNAAKLEIHRGTVHAEYASGAAWPFPGEFGEFTLVVFGGSGGAVKEIKRVTFKIYPCAASQSFDAELGLYVLKISAGSFENIDFRLVLDGDKSIEEGTMAVVTAVGEHKLELYADGAAVNPELYAYYGMPTAEDLALRINVELESNVWDIPRTLDFSRWDANILLDGEAVTGEFLIDEDGDHVITVVDDEGNAVSNCFSIKVGDAEAAVGSELNVTFDNPHHLYFWFILIPVILVLIAMIGFLILRRVIV